MRNAFADEVTKLAIEDNRVVFLSGDIGNKLFDKLKLAVPDRFFNCGVAEANMISLGCGLAAQGLRPIAYTITPFITYRCIEQIRVDACYHNQPIIIVGVGSGLGYTSLGATHHSLEDIAMLRALPNMTVLCPCDPVETRLALRASLNLSGPVYIRLGKKGEPVLHKDMPNFRIGEPIKLKQGDKLCILSCGTITPRALEVKNATVFSFHTVKPLNSEFLRECFNSYEKIITLEEHSLIGGFGSAVAEWAVDNGLDTRKLKRLGTKDKFLYGANDYDYGLEELGLGLINFDI